MRLGMISMFANEAHVLPRMLESTLGRVNYYVLQDNGSTDGSGEIARNFLKEHNLEGFVYDCPEGWKGFGWNRNHVLQFFQDVDHHCDYILKMDSDETLVIDEDFDWSIFDQTETEAWNVTCEQGPFTYQRCWLWSTKLRWAFYDDPAHETIYVDDGRENPNEYTKVRLPRSFRHESFTDGETYSNPRKYIIDSLKLEQKLMEEGYRESMYHFWYLGKSYYDALNGDFPLPQTRKEYRKRAIETFNNWIQTADEEGWNYYELRYWAHVLLGDLYRTDRNYKEAEDHYVKACGWCHDRSEWLLRCTHMFLEMKNLQKARTLWFSFSPACTTFPEHYEVFLNRFDYDNGPHVQDLYKALESGTDHGMSVGADTRTVIIENFYENPDEVRELALSLDYNGNSDWYKGKRSSEKYFPPGIKEKFEKALGTEIKNIDVGASGLFQITTSEDPQVYHYDEQKWAAVVFLTPNAPIESGTRIHASNTTSALTKRDDGINDAFPTGFFDSTNFPVISSAGNIYNRCIIFDGQSIHSAGPYFGNTDETGRLVHLFFFE